MHQTSRDQMALAMDFDLLDVEMKAQPAPLQDQRGCMRLVRHRSLCLGSHQARGLQQPDPLHLGPSHFPVFCRDVLASELSPALVEVLQYWQKPKGQLQLVQGCLT